MRYLLDIWSGCWSDHQTDIENGEVGLSQALLADGYNIASMQHEYAGLDFRRQPDRLQCKGRQGANPTFCCDVPGMHSNSSNSNSNKNNKHSSSNNNNNKMVVTIIKW